MYVIVKYKDDSKTYLDRNNLKIFNPINNAWTTNDLELAIRILQKVKKESREDINATHCKINVESCVPMASS